MNRITDKVAIVTGAARGQGLAQAELLAAEGAAVVLTDVRSDMGRAAAKSIPGPVAFEEHDVTSETDWDRVVAATVDRFGKVDVLINNAGVFALSPIETTSTAEFHEVVSVNQMGPFLGIRACIDPMRAAGGGSIVNIASVNSFVGLSGAAAYTSSKFGLRGLTKAAALELGRDKIRVNSVHPGGIDTPMVANPDLDDVDRNAQFRRQPIPRIGRTSEVASMVLYLASDESSYCTGAEFIIDGGWLAGKVLDAFASAPDMEEEPG